MRVEPPAAMDSVCDPHSDADTTSLSRPKPHARARPPGPPRADAHLREGPVNSSITDGRVEVALRLTEVAVAGGGKVGTSAAAASVGLSRSRFEHLFKARTGTTFRLAVRAMRLAKAKVLLRDPRLRVKEIAAQCGYASTSSFDREFRSKSGVTPSNYRRSTSG